MTIAGVRWPSPAARARIAALMMGMKTFREVYDEWHRAKLSKRSVHSRRAARTVDRYALRTIGDMPIQKVDTNIILDTVSLRRLWMEQNPTGVHLHSFLKRIFSFAIASKYYLGANPAAWRRHPGALRAPQHTRHDRPPQ